jgi:oxalate---CoA ligase
MEENFGTVVLEAYGMTEAANQVSCNPLPGIRKPISVGTGAGVDVSVLSAEGTPLGAGARGQVTIRGESVMSGYHRRAEVNAASF